ncbi:amidophosphoribosyltransferase [Polyangium aurulentum]|uniref:amidophosphoribosyltransferase n=1 Tax=Polyangium aurulentum TaxID=2567896 RepID=UPI0010AEA8DB|nr:amidophosphoribosyltransferase [Polyangium aurulentum]UQA58727.1 amidophosphoribosyltransferase [Polyangium aurulentum]
MCGVFGIFGHPEAANITYLGLHALQHRGQESAGIVTSDGERLTPHRAMGLVQAGFTPADLAQLEGDRAIGHVRYSTAGGSHIRNAQPFAVDYARGSIAVAHNGNLTNHEVVRERLEARGSIFQSVSDTEVIVHLIAASTQTTAEGRVAEALREVEGAYSILFLTESELIAVRDPMGFRPLCMGKMKHAGGEAIVVASEPTSFDLIGATYVRDLEPGEMLVVGPDGVRSSKPFAPQPRKLCIFEHVYFARPDSLIEGASVYEVRKALGRKLAEESPVPGGTDGGDVVVIPVPDSGLPAAIGFADRARAPFEMGLIRSHYVGRTFIEPQQSIRHFGVRLKLSPNRAALQGKRVIVVDDSIVRGTTSRKIVKMVRDAGAKEVHLRISSPPTRWPCFYGIDTPTRSELIAASHSIDEICKYVTADSVGYLSLEGLVTAVRSIERAAQTDGREPGQETYCHACFSGAYPVAFAPAHKGRQLRLVAG